MTNAEKSPLSIQEEDAQKKRIELENKPFETGTDLELVAKYLKTDLKKVISYCAAGAKSIGEIKMCIQMEKEEKKKKRVIVDRWGKYF